MDNRQLIVGRLQEHGAELESFTQGLTEKQLKERPAAEQWSIHEIVIHLAERQSVYVERLAAMLVEESPVVKPYALDQDRRNGFYLKQNFAQQVKLFQTQRGTLVALLHSLNEKQWQQEGRLAEVRHYTVEKCMESLMRSEEHYLDLLFRVFFGVNE